MGAIGRGKKLLAANVEIRTFAYVAHRAKKADCSPTRFAGYLVQHWLESGAPVLRKSDVGADEIPWDASFPWEDFEPGTIPAQAEVRPRANLAKAARRI